VVRLNRSRSLCAPPLWERGVSQVMLPNMVFELWIVLGLSKWDKGPFGQSRTYGTEKKYLSVPKYLWIAALPKYLSLPKYSPLPNFYQYPVGFGTEKYFGSIFQT